MTLIAEQAESEPASDTARFWSGPLVDVPFERIHDAFEWHVDRNPEAVAAVHNGDQITYGDLNRRAELLALTLAAHGVQPGDNVALFVRRSIPMLVGLVAILKAGAAYVPQDVRIAPRTQLEHVIRTAATSVILTLSDCTDLVPTVDGTTTILIDGPLAEGTYQPAGLADPASAVSTPRPSRPSRPSRPGDGGDGCYVLFTSGTTGKPNGVTITHRNVRNLLLTAPGDLGIQPGWRVAQLLNIAFDMASWEILGALSHGATLVIRSADIATTAAEVDVLIATPSILSTIDPERCPGVKVVAVAGEPCPRPLADRWAAFCAFYNGCGPTEVTIVNTMQRHEVGADLTIGRPTPNNTVYVLDERGRPCTVGQTGEMWAGGDCVSVGYLSNDVLTRERYRPDPFLGGGRRMFRTRDLGRWTANGELEHLGRTDDQVKIRGFRVELDSVSAVLEAMPGCTRAVTLKLDRQTLVAFVAPAAIEPASARAAVAAALPYYCVPAVVYSIATLPETDRGKIAKSMLLERARLDLSSDDSSRRQLEPDALAFAALYTADVELQTELTS